MYNLQTFTYMSTAIICLNTDLLVWAPIHMYKLAVILKTIYDGTE